MPRRVKIDEIPARSGAQRVNTLLTLQDVARAREFYEKGYWRGDTLYTLLRHWAQISPDRFALRDTNSRLSYRALIEWVDAVAQTLHDAGMRPGERVSLWLPSRAESVMLFLACSRMGYVCNTSLHRDYTCREVVDLLRRAGTVAFFAEPGYGADAERNDIFAMLGELPQLRQTTPVAPLTPEPSEGDAPTRFSGLSRLANCELPYSTDPDRVVYLAFTSGTTGEPKGVMHSDNTLLANGRAIVRDWAFDQNLVTYTLSPMSHNIGTVGLVTTLVAGGEFVVHTPMDAKRTLDRVIETGASFMLGVPTHAIDLLRAAKARGLASLGKVNAFQLGGAPIPPATVAGLMQLGVRPQNSFGMTENCSFQYTRPDDPPETVVDSCGRPCEGFELRLWHPEDRDREVGVGEIGELGCRGACLMLGYFDDQENTERSFNRHGWFMTGDLGQVDAQGNLRIVGRKKDLINRGGRNIHPARIEAFALRHHAVVKAAAFAVPDERLGERVCLAVIPTAKGAVKPLELLRHLDALGLSKFDMPEYFVELDVLPLTASGKVLKRRLRELVAEGKVNPEPIRMSK